MILTLTPNPSHDRTVALGGRLERGAVLRAESVTSQAGGKGVNISRASVSAGIPSIAVLPADPDDPYVHELLAAGIDCRPVPTSGTLRINLTISEPDGTTTKLNSPGPTVTADVLAALTESLRHRAGSADWVVLAGSLPPGAPVGWYAEWWPRCATRAGGSRSTPATARSGRWSTPWTCPRRHLMKPNGEELASFTHADGLALESDPVAAAGAACDLVERGVETVLATLGPHGAVLVNAEGAWHDHAPADHRGQHGGRGRLQPLRLPPRGPARAGPRRPTRARRRLRQRGRRTPRHDHPATRPGPARVVAVRALDLTQGG